MPRPRKPENEAHRAEQERYRARLRERSRPEASHVDIAVAAAVAVSFSRSRGKSKSEAAFDALVGLAKEILVDYGFDPVEADRKIRGRLQCRDDLDALNRITSKPPEGRSSPHYLGLRKRFSQVSHSEEGTSK